MTELPSELPVENVSGLTALGVAQAGEFSAVVLESRRDRAVTGRWQARNLHYVDLCLTGRPMPSRGRFVECNTRSMDLGDIFFVPAGLSMDTSGSAGWQRGLRLYCSSTHSSVRMDDAFAAPSRFLSIDSSDVRRTLVQLSREVVSPGFASDIMFYGLCMTTMAQLARFGSSPSRDRGAGGLSHWRIRLLDERLHASGPPPTVKELAGLCRLSERHLLRAFRQETGETLGNHVSMHAMGRACQQLAHGNWPIARIAHEAGFQSSSSFTAAFRRRMGVTPAAYRTEHQ
jgi:AraC family transcriptional regulator